MSGSGPATVAALGLILIPAMVKNGYDKAFAAANVSVTSGLAIVIPPSIAFIVYGGIADASVPALFAAGIVPGLLVCVVLPVRAQKKTGKLCFPLDTTQYRVSDGYGWRQDPFTGERTFHKGIDLACAEGTEVLAAEGGAVVQAYRSTSYGTCLRVLHTDGSESLYAHLQYAYVRPGEVVEAGQLLGAAGRSGRATGAHLHFELYRQGTACDPADALGLSS